MSSYQQAPKLPREPTLIRVNDSITPDVTATRTDSESAPQQMETTTEAQRKPSRDLPPPPRFPSMNDVAAPLWTQPQPPADADASDDVSWTRTADPLEPTAAPDPAEDEPEPCVDDAAVRPTGFVAKIMAIFKKKKTPSAATTAPAPEPVRPKPAGVPPLVKAKQIICRLPDPTLFFVLQATVILLIHTLKPHLLQTWTARIVTPLLLVPTVAATALWRPTRVISLKPEPDFISAAAPIPNAGKLVSLGESLRVREAAVVKAEDELRQGQMKLEVLRKEIEGRLPPTISIANLLDQENDASRFHQHATPVAV